MMLCSEADWQKIHTEPANRAADEETWCATLDEQTKMFPAIVRAGEWLTPTLTVWRSGDMIGRPNAKVLAAKLSGSATVWPELQQWWDSEMGSPPFTDFQRSLLERAPEMAAAASQAGVKLLAGTDLGDPYVVPGYSLHDELELMVAAGCANAQGASERDKRTPHRPLACRQRSAPSLRANLLTCSS